MRQALRSFLARYADDDRGNTAAIVAVCIVFLLGTAAMATDVGYVYFSKLKLQASADAAALAGATMITDNGGDPLAEATSFSAAAGNKNASNNFVATMASGYPKLVCSTTLKNQADPCITTFTGAPPSGANSIQVVENATVPSFFAKVFGVSHFTVSATSTAAARGGQPQPLDIEVIMDTTASMGSTDANCGLGSHATRLDCAKFGLQTLLLALSPSVQYVGVLVFPGFPSAAQAKQDVNCSGTTPTIDQYYGAPAYNNPLVMTAPIYQIAALANDYRSSNGSTTLKSSSNAAQASGGVSGCPGLSAPGGVGTYYSQAIAAAEADLTANGDPKAKHAIILLSDGEANAKSAVIAVTIANAGTGYNAAPLVTFSGGGGSGAAGTAIMAGSGSTQTVSRVNITNIGSGYTSQPTATFTTQSGKKGSGATGTPVLSPGLQQCHQASTAGGVATAAGTQVYTVAYGSSTSTSDCSTDTAPTITPCLTLQDIATSVDNFYSDGSGGTSCPNAHAVTNLASAFQSIASSITSVRLVPDGWFST